MSKVSFINALIMILCTFYAGCTHSQNEHSHTFDEGENPENVSDYPNVSTYMNPKSDLKVDSVNAIISQETQLFQLLKNGFFKFELPIQASGYEGFFPESYNGVLQRLQNKCDTLQFDNKNDTIFWQNMYDDTGSFSSLTSSRLSIRYYSFYDTHWLSKPGDDFITFDRTDNEYFVNMLNDKKRLHEILKHEFEQLPFRSILGVMIITNCDIVYMDTAYYGNLFPSVNGGKCGSFFEIPDSIYEMYCRRPDKK